MFSKDLVREKNPRQHLVYFLFFPLHLNYARENWTRPEENLTVGLILCAYKDKAMAKYPLEGLPNKIFAAEYKTALPDERVLAEELARTRKALDARQQMKKNCRLS